MLKLRAGKKSKGQSLAEYGLILGLISIVAIGALTTMGGQLKDTMTQIQTALGKAQTTVKNNAG